MSHPFDSLLARVPGIQLKTLAARVHQFRGQRVLVLGDLMLDEYIWGAVNRISPEAPVPIVEAQRHTYGLGGAANVANNVQALGGKVTVAGVVGEDSHGETLTGELRRAGVETFGVVALAGRPTTSKLRIVAHSHMNSQQIVRVDRESREKIDPATAQTLLDRALSALPEVDAVLVSDYNKGVWVPDLAHPLVKACKKASIPVTVNMKPSNLHCLPGASLVTSNHYEAEIAALSIPMERWSAGRPVDFNTPETMEELGRCLREFIGCESLCITRGAKGLSLFGRDAIHHLPPIPAEVYDGTGAGDTVVSIAAMTLACGGTPLEAAVLGNAGGAIQVHRLGAVAVSDEELLALITDGTIEPTVLSPEA